METTNYQPSTINQQASDEISLKELIQKLREWFTYLKTQWWKIVIAGMIGGAIGFVYAWMQPITYTAKTTFVVEDAKGGGGLSGLASLAGQFGVDVGGGGGGSLIAGDNILLYFKSESLAREVLLSDWDSLGIKSFADAYADAYELSKIWQENPAIGKIIFSKKDSSIQNRRVKDSLLQEIIKSINKDKFSINRIDKKAGFLEVRVTAISENWAKLYCDKIVEKAVKRYLLLKTERQQNTVDKLQKRVDSIGSLLNSKTKTSATLQNETANMDVNPIYRTGSTIAAELTNRDKAMLTAVYGEIVKNLELAKFTLSQETPVIQVVDSSNLPLIKNKISRLSVTIQLSLLFSFLCLLIIILKKFLTSLL